MKMSIVVDRNALWKITLIRGESNVIRVARIGASTMTRQFIEADIQNGSDKVRDWRRARATLRQLIIVACYLRQNSAGFFRQSELIVCFEKSPHSAKID